MIMGTINESMRVGEIMRLYPELTDYLMELGLCGCEFGPESNLNLDVARAAEEKDLDINELLNELNRRINA